VPGNTQNGQNASAWWLRFSLQFRRLTPRSGVVRDQLSDSDNLQLFQFSAATRSEQHSGDHMNAGPTAHCRQKPVDAGLNCGPRSATILPCRVTTTATGVVPLTFPRPAAARHLEVTCGQRLCSTACSWPVPTKLFFLYVHCANCRLSRYLIYNLNMAVVIGAFDGRCGMVAGGYSASTSPFPSSTGFSALHRCPANSARHFLHTREHFPHRLAVRCNIILVPDADQLAADWVLISTTFSPASNYAEFQPYAWRPTLCLARRLSACSLLHRSPGALRSAHCIFRPPFRWAYRTAKPTAQNDRLVKLGICVELFPSFAGLADASTHSRNAAQGRRAARQARTDRSPKGRFLQDESRDPHPANGVSVAATAA